MQETDVLVDLPLKVGHAHQFSEANDFHLQKNCPISTELYYFPFSLVRQVPHCSYRPENVTSVKSCKDTTTF